MTARNRFLTLVIALYILPVVALSFYASLIFSPSHSFGILTVGVLLTVAGSILLFLLNEHPLSPQAEDAPPAPVAAIEPSPPEVDHGREEELQGQVNDYRQQLYEASRQGAAALQQIAELQKVKETLERKLTEQTAEATRFQEGAREHQEQTRQLLHEHQQTINEQREMLEKKQQQIIQLEGQVRDLNYEIKTLMEVEERQSIIRFPAESRYRSREYDYAPVMEEEDAAAPPMHVHGPDEASQQLKRCLDIAQKITGAQYMQNRPSRLKDLPVESTALEMRRLFDNLRSENQATILLYSPKDNKLLFVNNPIKSLLGWPPEKFVQQFQELQTDGGEAWRQSLGQLSFKNESQTTLWLAAKTGQHVPLNCHLGLIPTGSFRHFVLGVLYPANK